MNRSIQASFRTILLLRLLLLSVPVLLTGEFFAYQKARSSLLENARQNLTDSAVQQGALLRQRLVTARSILGIAQAGLLPLQKQTELPQTLQVLQSWLGPEIHCLQVVSLAAPPQAKPAPPTLTPPTPAPLASSCPELTQTEIVIATDKPLAQPPAPPEPTAPPHPGLVITPLAKLRPNTEPPTLLLSLPLAPPTLGEPPSVLQGDALQGDALQGDALQGDALQGDALQGDAGTAKPQAAAKLKPTDGQSALQLQVVLMGQRLPTSAEQLPSVLVLLDHNNQVLAHPDGTLIGQSVKDQLAHASADMRSLQNVVHTLQANAPPQEPISFFQGDQEWLAGISRIPIEANPGQVQEWTVMALVPMNRVLSGLDALKQVFALLTLGLLATNFLAAFYLARDLAFPLEQLGGYALQLHDSASEAIPANFRIREFNQLAAALDSMVSQLQERAEELETAWQEALSANQLKSDFLATTSHELRTPLNAIIGCVRLVRDDCCDSHAEELEFLQQADAAAMHLLQIINDLLDIAKIEAGKAELHLKPVAVQQMCQQCLKMVRPGAEKKKLDLTLDIDPRIQRVTLDEQRVRQMMINLLSNAVKFTPEQGRVKLSVRHGYGYQLLKDQRPDNSPINEHSVYLCLEVSDSGIGIQSDRWHLLFRPFQQIDGSHTRRHEGTGLGLALSKRMAELHGGTISFQSSTQHGSIFRIWLPASELQPQTLAEPPSSETAGLA